MPTSSRSSASRPHDIAVVGALRTPIGRYLGSFSGLSAADLGVGVVVPLLESVGLAPDRVDELIFGNGRQAGGGPNVARQVSIRSGLPATVPAWTMNMACGSSLKALNLGAESIRAGRNRIVIAGGTESMSGLPFFLPKMRTGYRLGHAPLVDSMYQDGFLCPLAGMLMGETADKLAQELEISREAQDEFAASSQAKCAAARGKNLFADEIVPVDIPQRRGDPLRLEHDEHPRDGVDAAKLAKLPAVFDREHGTVSAGNSSGITDGASAVVLADARLAEELDLPILAFVGEATQAGVDPVRMGLGPVPAMEALRERNGLAPEDYDLVELNEAFAAQVLACHKQIPLPMERLNVNGGSIALGHPIGATGTRIVATLLHELRRRGGDHGLATLCISGGMGIATAFHRDGL